MTVTAISEYAPRASVTRIVDVYVPVSDAAPTCRYPPELEVPVKDILAFAGELTTVITKVPVPPDISYNGDLKRTPLEVSKRELPVSDGGGATTIVNIIDVVALAVSVAVTVS